MAKSCFGRFGLQDADSQETVCHAIGFLSFCATCYDALGGTAQILNEYDPEGDGNRPELSDGKRLDRLIGTHKPTQRLEFKSAVGMSDECPCYPEDTRVALERSFRKLWELPIVASWEIVMDFTDLLIDDMEVINQPLRRRHDNLSVAAGFGDGAIGPE